MRMIPPRLHVSFLSSLFISSLALFGLTSCAPAINTPWQSTDLRALDPLDAPDPGQDLIAIYTRSEGFEDHIRLDFLDLPDQPNVDIYVAIDTQPGGSEMAHLSRLDLQALYPEGLVKTEIAYDLLLVIPADGEPEVIDVARSTVSTRIQPRLLRDPELDTITVILNRFDLPAKYSLQVFITPAGEHTPVDQTGAIASDASIPNRAPLLMAFSQTFPATTPAQVLRRWDGAHTGPYGERHGLNPLLEAAATYHIPLTLLDVKTPASLSALDLAGGIDKVKRMWRNRLMILPDVVYGKPGDVALAHSLYAAKSFGLPTGQFFFGNDPVTANYPFQFYDDPNGISPLSLLEWQGKKMLGIPSFVEEQTTPFGPTLDTKRALILSALEDGKEGIVFLGGNLPLSTWGDSDSGPTGLRYIAAHPWIQPLDADSLLALQAIPVQADPRPSVQTAEPVALYNPLGQDTGLDSAKLQKQILARLEVAPQNPITDSAWEMYFLLTAPVSDPKLAELNAQYLGDINILLTAADWANAPASQSTCSVDLNADLIPDCVIANEKIFAVFQSDGGRLSYLFSRDKRGVHQVVSPGWQFTTGLSDRTEWKNNLGAAADPSQIPGAFYTPDSPWRGYAPRLESETSLTFSTPNGERKTYQVVENGVSLEYGNSSSEMRMGLTLDPWRRFEPGWGKNYKGQVISESLEWRLASGPVVQVDGKDLTLYAFNDTLNYLGKLEDPNQDFPPGHYLPFPMALLKAPLEFGSQIVLQIK